jgi:hypothetical protein
VQLGPATGEGARRREAPAALREEDRGSGARPGPAAATSFFTGRPWRAPKELLAAARARMERCGVLAGAKKKVQGLELGFY